MCFVVINKYDKFSILLQVSSFLARYSSVNDNNAQFQHQEYGNTCAELFMTDAHVIKI